jgi:hypothetical protein
MDLSLIFALVGFSLAAYSVVGNDVIQTLGTFLTSNEDRPWWVLWLYAGGLMTFTLIIGYLGLGELLGGSDVNDIAFDRLDGIVSSDSYPAKLTWEYLLPPVVLLLITRLGIPVSTTFLILSFFSIKSLPDMLIKSLSGYAVAFVLGLAVMLVISKAVEKIFHDRALGSDGSLWTNKSFWTGLQWLSTGFLWMQWLTQDLANIYVYFGNPEQLSLPMFIFSMVVLMGLLGYIFYQKGGAIQNIVREKTNTDDIRSATIIDFLYGLVLIFFKGDLLGLGLSKIPMSTTWVFLGILAGRELGIRLRLGPKPDAGLSRMLFSDLGKAALGLVVSIVLVILLKIIQGRPVMELMGL